MKSANRLPVPVLLLALPLVLWGCAKDNTSTTAPSTEAQYVGSAACRPCHQDAWDVVNQSGHPHMLTRVVSGQKPGAPLILPDQPPPGKSWGQIKYVIGGWGWKAQFVTTDDQVIVGEGVQYNIPTPQYPAAEWVAYSVGTAIPYNYDNCFQCHTTGPNRTNNTFAEPGIQCEACHGPGSLHAATPTRAAVLMDDSAELCRRCHSRPPTAYPGFLPTDRFLLNYDQYREMKSGAHRDLTCSSCHLHHVGVRRDQTGGIIKQCTSCHEGVQVSHFGNIDCITCHMPYATKSARSRDKYVADVRSHVFKVHAGPEDQAQMFDDVGNVKDDYGVTLDYVCYQCHRDALGVGGSNSKKSLQELAYKASRIHVLTKKAANGR